MAPLGAAVEAVAEAEVSPEELAPSVPPFPSSAPESQPPLSTTTTAQHASSLAIRIRQTLPPKHETHSSGTAWSAHLDGYVEVPPYESGIQRSNGRRASQRVGHHPQQMRRYAQRFGVVVPGPKSPRVAKRTGGKPTGEQGVQVRCPALEA